jgi:amino acid permease
LIGKKGIIDIMSTPAKPPALSKKIVFGSIAVGTGIVALIFLFARSGYGIASLAFLFGGLLLAYGYYHLVYVLPKMTKDVETRISMEALRASFWVVIVGLIIIVLGLLYLMNLLPPPR